MAGAIVWTGIYVAASMLLNAITRATFDDRLGRIPDDGLRPPSRPRGRSSLSAAELVALVSSIGRGRGDVGALEPVPPTDPGQTDAIRTDRIAGPAGSLSVRRTQSDRVVDPGSSATIGEPGTRDDNTIATNS